MVSQAQYWKVEEYEPVNSHLWVEMSPLPTRFNRQIADDVEDNLAEDIRKRTHMYGDRWELGERLAASKDKDCDRQPHQYAFSPTYERGKACMEC